MVRYKKILTTCQDSSRKFWYSVDHVKIFKHLVNFHIFWFRYQKRNYQMRIATVPIFGQLHLKISLQRSSRLEVFCKKGFLRNFVKFTEKHQRQSLFFSLFCSSATSARNFIEKRLWHRCFPVNFLKFLRTSFPQSTSGQLLLKMHLSPV